MMQEASLRLKSVYSTELQRNYNSFFCWLELQQFFCWLELQQFFLLAGITTVYKWEIGDA